MFITVIFMSPTGVVSTVVPDSAHKLFIGGLPNYLNDDQVGISPWDSFASKLGYSWCTTLVLYNAAPD